MMIGFNGNANILVIHYIKPFFNYKNLWLTIFLYASLVFPSVVCLCLFKVLIDHSFFSLDFLSLIITRSLSPYSNISMS